MFGLSSAQRQSKAQQRQQISRVLSLPAPIGGWNARDALAAMPPSDAVTLINWWPSPSSVNIRNGFANWATGFTAPVQTLMLFAGGEIRKLFAAAGTAIYDATAEGAIGGAVQTGLTNAQWSYTMFATSAGVQYLVAVNGADLMRVYSTAGGWQSLNAGSTPAVTGVVTSTLSFVLLYLSRLWAIVEGTLQLWYSPVGGFGAFSLFDLTPIFRRGGQLVALELWTVDGGYGMQDYLVAITDQGEVAIYGGTDPSTPGDFSLVGVYYFSAPVGDRPLFKFGGDVLILTTDGIFPLSRALQSSRVDTKAAITDKILYAFQQAVQAYGQNFGWQIQTVPLQNALVVNIPTSTSTAVQYVMNTITGAWTQFNGWNIFCMEPWGENLFGGFPTQVGWLFQNYDDAGTQIVTTSAHAYNYFGQRGMLKEFLMARPLIQTTGNIGLSLGMNVDFNPTTQLTTPSYVPSGGATWGSGVWGVSTWGVSSSFATQKSWQFLSGIGYSGSFLMQTASLGVQGQFASVDVLYQQGGVL